MGLDPRVPRCSESVTEVLTRCLRRCGHTVLVCTPWLSAASINPMAAVLSPTRLPHIPLPAPFSFHSLEAAYTEVLPTNHNQNNL